MTGLHETLFRRGLYPFYESVLRRRRTFAYLKSYERDQWLDGEAIARLQWQRLQALLAHCWREVPYYRQQWEGLGITPDDIRSMADYQQLPVLTKDDIRTHFDALKASSLRDELLYKTTGGSTGVPLRLGYTRESYERRSAVMWRGYGWSGSRIGRRSLYLWGGPVGQPGRWSLMRERIYHAMFARRMLDCFRMTESNMGEYATAIDHYRPDIIVSYVQPLYHLASWMLANAHQGHRPVAVITCAEALHPFQRETIEQAFGAPVSNTYGCREFMLIAAECEQHDGLHINADHLLVEVIKQQHDGVGEVAITDLFNYGMPFLRYVNGDLATPMAGACACGRALPRLRAVDGRKLDAIRNRAGVILPGEFFPSMLKDVPGLLAYQAVQRTLDSLDLYMVRGPEFDADSLAYVRAEIERALGSGVELRVHFVTEIAASPSGKQRVTRSEILDAP